MKALLISTYDLGRQPFGLASPAAWLKADGWHVTCVDAAKQKLEDATLAGADLVGFHLPMHTATRLAAPVIARARRLNPAARLCAYGLYAPLNADWLRSIGVDDVLGGEFEADLTEVARRCHAGLPLSPVSTAFLTARGPTPGGGASAYRGSPGGGRQDLARLRFLVPDRTTLPPLARYAMLQSPGGSRRLVGYTEASRGCKHLCRHCPIVPIYNGQFRIVQSEVVLADVAGQIAAGAQHITFGDPDFLNGPAHAMRVVEALHEAHPGVSYDVTVKVEHLLKHRDLLARLAATGCAFVTSAVESVDDRVLTLLDKGHTRAGFVEAAALCRAVGLTMVPTFVAFHPWLTLEGYCDLLNTIEDLDLVGHVAPIQLAIRLLVPEGSRLLTLDEFRPHVGAFDPSTLTYRWRHPDARVDDVHREVSTIVGARPNADRQDVFDEIRSLAHARADMPPPSGRPARDRATIPYLDEPWYC
jgi:radical SAM superfamily enzyme YgiQ (UPF0313 family)